MDDDLKFVLFDKHDSFRRQISGLESYADIVPNGVSTASFVLDDDSPALAAATADGARCAVWFRGAERFRGWVNETPGNGPRGRVTIEVESDHRKFWHWYGRQVPSAPLSAQTAEYRVYTGKSEAVFKSALAENIARLGVPWTVAPNHGYGGSPVRVEFRMHPLADKLIPLLDADNLVIVLTYPEPGAVRVDVRQAKTVPGILTIDSGVPDSYEFNRLAPTATRVTVGGRGEGVAREFVEVIDTAREATWGDIRETFVDARNTEVGADLSIEGRQALEEAAPKVGVTTELVETKRFRLGTTYDVGDLVRVRVGPVDSLERISVSITQTARDGVTVTPYIGSADVSTDTEVALAAAVAKLARGIRDSGRR